MNLNVVGCVAGVSLVLAVGSAGCDKDAGKAGAASASAKAAVTAAPTATGATKPAATTAATTAASAKAAHKMGSGKKVEGKATKGGDGKKKPEADSKKTSAVSAKSDSKKKVEGDENPCTDAPDMAAECDGDNLYVCIEKELYVLDCNELAKGEGATAGTCFETGEVTDCMGCIADDAGNSVCCDMSETICCDNEGNCETAEAAGGDDAAGEEDEGEE